MRKGSLLLGTFAAFASCVPGPNHIELVNEVTARPHHTNDDNVRIETRDVTSENLSRLNKRVADPGWVPPPILKDVWGLVCHTEFTNQNCQLEAFGYQCTRDGNVGYIGKSIPECDAQCGCIDFRTGGYKDSKGRSIRLTRVVDFRDVSNDRAPSPWIFVCEIEWARDNCPFNPYAYDCDQDGDLIRYGIDEHACDHECDCEQPEGNVTKPGNGKSRPVSPGQALHPERSLETRDEPLAEDLANPPPAPDASEIAAPQKPTSHDYALVCEGLWQHNRCSNEPYKYTCNISGQLERYGERNEVCETKCRCINTDTNKLESAPKGGAIACDPKKTTWTCAISRMAPKEL